MNEEETEWDSDKEYQWRYSESRGEHAARSLKEIGHPLPFTLGVAKWAIRRLLTHVPDQAQELLSSITLEMINRLKAEKEWEKSFAQSVEEAQNLHENSSEHS